MEHIPLLHVLALSGMGGIVKMSVNAEPMTLRGCGFTLLHACFAAFSVVFCTAHLLPSPNIVYGVAAVTGFVSDSLLIGVRKAAAAFRDDPLQTFAKLFRNKK